MANTKIQIRRSTGTSTPPNGTLSAGEQAYSYSSNTLFIGTPDGTGVIAVGGKYYLDTINAAFAQANSAYNQANSGAAVAGAFTTANLAYAKANTANITADIAFNVANQAFAKANTANITADLAFNTANNALPKAGGTITGNLAVTGTLTVQGNVYLQDTQTLTISDPLLYLAGNNYVSDIVDIGFVANYVNATGQNVHTGIFRDATIKEYYVFEGYDKEPNPNHIDPAGNNFTIAMLNASLRTSNLVLGGANAILTIGAAFNHANNAYGKANIANITADLAFTHANNAYAKANSANIQADLAFLKANQAFAQANSASAQAANADFLTTGTVGTSRLSGSYTGITGVGTITAGTWNGSTIGVPYGGTGVVTFTTNGILYGNSAGDIKVTSAGTEGQVLQASSTGVPSFAMLDGGSF